MWFSRKPKPNPTEVASGLRAQALALDHAALGLTPTAARPHVWGILMETGYPQAVATLVALADGTTSLYFSNGGGVIGAGAHATVRRVLPSLFAAAETHIASFVQTAVYPPPEKGHVRFYVRTFGGTLTADATENDLGTMRHVLSPVFHAGHAVITAVREASGG